MQSPFPGMDPYLESPGLWPDVHLEMISKIRSALNPRILPKYIVQVETRVYVSQEDHVDRRAFVPDITVEKPRRSKAARVQTTALAVIDEPLIVPYVNPIIEEAYLVIMERKTHLLVTAIEVLSPANKIKRSEGRKSYMDKRSEFLAGDVHIVEIDLLRTGDPPIDLVFTPTDYRVFVSRAEERTRQRYWPIKLRDPLPTIGIPLKGDDPDVPLDLGELLNIVYDSGAYNHLIDYRKPCNPPLKPADARWANKILKGAKLR
jgi:Protein of unknown function (DUF4058)